MDKIQLRLECLKMALGFAKEAGMHDEKEVFRLAKEFEHYAQDIPLPEAK